MKSNVIRFSMLMIACLLALVSKAQVTNASFTGSVKDGEGKNLGGATVVATHEPSGSVFSGSSNTSGYYSIPGVRVGGPYKITVNYSDYIPVEVNDIYITLGQDFVLDLVAVAKGSSLDTVSIKIQRSKLLNSQNTGASTNIDQEALNTLPTLSRNLNDFLRLTPQSRSSSVASTTGNGVSFSGQDSRFNNLTIDGSIFNNSFGLASAPAGQTASTPISLDAIQEIQINLAPYDVRLGGFTGAGINAVTRSGTNNLEGSAFMNIRNNNMVGKKAAGVDVQTNEYNVQQIGFRLGGAIVKNKLFFFVNAEEERRNDPGTQFKANRGEPSGTANVTRVRASALDSLQDFLKSKYNYDAGEYDGYKRETYSFKYLMKLDWNINEKNKFSLRYNSLISRRDVLASNSGVFSGNRNGTVNALNFSNNNYIINNNLYSIIGELNTNISNNLFSSFQVGYTANRDFRGSGGGIFPLVDIMEAGQTYTSFGYEPFTPNNILNTNTLQIQENLTYYKGRHTVNAGFNFEHFAFENTFTPTYYGQFIYKSLGDFYKSANGDTSVQLARYALTYSAVENGALPTASPKVNQLGAYIQDNFRVSQRLKVTAGVRIDIPSYSSESEYWNKKVDTMKFIGPDGKTANYSTKTLPNARPLVSPRVGFNWNAKGNRDIQVRGGSGLFAGRPAFVWISNQLSNNGVTTGSMRYDNVRINQIPTQGGVNSFTQDVTAFIPANPTTPSSFNLALTDPNFKFPQLWRTDLGVDAKLPWGMIGTVEVMYNKTINNINYLNVNQVNPLGNYAGPDNRAYYGYGNNANRINDNVTDAILLTNTNKGYNYSTTLKVEKPATNGLGFMVAYNFSETKDIITGGSIAFSSWRDNRSVQGNNTVDLAFSDNDQRHRIIGALTYKTKSKNFPTTISVFMQSGNMGRYSMSYSNDMNGDLLANNDLLYIPNSADEINWKQTVVSKDTATVQEQKDAFNSLLSSDEYLSANKGSYAQRNGVLMNWLTTFDLSIIQDIKMTNSKKHSLQLRFDVYNVGNLLNNAWGVSDQVNYAALLKYEGKDANNNPIYSLNRDKNNKLISSITSKSAGLNDVWQMQFGLRYTFN
ncbi:MAG: carboxypeptidase regulatory-like domain-containing protein [Bacteroidota bacterium]|jgi:hypothetical protein